MDVRKIICTSLYLVTKVCSLNFCVTNFFYALYERLFFLPFPPSPPLITSPQMSDVHWIIQGAGIGNVEYFYAMDGHVDFTLLRTDKLHSLDTYY